MPCCPGAWRVMLLAGACLIGTTVWVVGKYALAAFSN